MDPDYEDDDEEYTYEEDGEYDEDGDQEYEEEEAHADAAPAEASNGRRESCGAQQKSASHTPMSGEKKTDRGVVVPSDSFNIMDCAEIEPIMRALIEDVASLLDLNTDVTQALLQSHKWNREKLIDAFFANPEKVMKSSGLDLYVDTSDSFRSDSKSDGGGPVKLFRSSSNNTTLNPGETFRCRICYDDTANAFSMGCGHKFCRPCYSEYLSGQVNDGQCCIIAHCPEFKCTQLVTPSVFHSLLGNRRSTEAGPGSPASPNTRKIGVKSSKLVNQYDTYYVRNFIETCKNMKYCPAPGCEKVAVGSGVTMVRCSCGHPFCMRCGKFES
jgi:ariadne-1